MLMEFELNFAMAMWFYSLVFFVFLLFFLIHIKSQTQSER